MQFDKFCGVAERDNLPDSLARLFRSLAIESRLFVLEGDVREVLPKTVAMLGNSRETFFLPFDTIAVEDPTSCVIIRNPSPGALGLVHERLALEIRSVENEGRANVAATLDMDPQRLRDALLVTIGELSNIEPVGERFMYAYALHGVFLVSKHHGLILRMSDGPVAIDPATAAQNAMTAIEEVAWINNPEFFIFEKSVADRQKIRTAKGRIPRAEDRPTYRILHRGKIRQLLRIDDVSPDARGVGVIPHPRRAHRRLLKDDRYAASGRQNTQVFVRSTWVGPSEAVEGRYRYRVLLDV